MQMRSSLAKPSVVQLHHVSWGRRVADSRRGVTIKLSYWFKAKVHFRLKAARCAAVLVIVLSAALSAMARERWTAEQANMWYATQPWLVGSDYIPANAINQLEMWQADTFDP